jgi:hypothetical protein
MSQLEKLTLSPQVRRQISFIDGTHLDNDIISKMPCLHTFIFDILTEYVIIDEELLPTSEFSHLMTLNLSMSHIDYAKQFLLDSNTRLPRLSTLYIYYKKLAKATEDFTGNSVHANCEKLKKILFSLDYQELLERNSLIIFLLL